MFLAHAGEFAALLVAVFWTITALSFASASRQVGSLAVNIIRLVMAALLLSAFTLISRGKLFPSDASGFQWLWLSLSGLVGFVLGDLFLFKSYEIISARISMLIMALAPPIAAVTGWLFVGETMSSLSIAGMFITLSGIALVVLERNKIAPSEDRPRRRNGMKLTYPLSGLLLAFGGAAGQGIGIVLSKHGMQDYDAFAATQIRIFTGIVGFIAIITAHKAWGATLGAIKNPVALKNLTIGSFFGPFLGVSFSLIAVKHTSSGIASTIMAIVPVLIILPSVLIYKEKVTMKELLGAFLSVAGVSLFFID